MHASKCFIEREVNEVKLSIFPFASSAMLFPGWCHSVIFISCCRQRLMTFGLLQWVRAEPWSVQARGEMAHSWHWSEVDSLPSLGGISRMDCSSSRRRKLECGNKTLKRAGVSGSMCIYNCTPFRSSWVYFRRTLSISIVFFIVLAGFRCSLTDIQTV